MTEPSVNRYILGAFLDPLGTMDSEDDVAYFAGFSPSSEEAIRRLIREQIQPYYATWGPKSAVIGKDSIAYWLSFRPDELEFIFKAYMVALPVAANDDRGAWILRFFTLLWEELFGTENYHLPNEAAYEVRDDAWSASRVLIL